MATLKEIQDLLNKLNSTYKKLGESNPFENFDISKIKNITEETEKLEYSLFTAEKRLKDMDDSLDGIVGAFKAMVNEASSQNAVLNQSKSTFNSLISLSSKLRDDQNGVNKLSQKELISLNAKIKLKGKELESNEKQLTNQIETLKKEGASTELLKKHNNMLIATTGQLKDYDSIYEELIKEAQERLQLEEKTNKALGLGGNIISGTSKVLSKIGLGGLSKQLGLDEARDKMREVAERTAKGKNEAASFGDKMEVLKSGISSMGKSLITNLKDPLTIVGTVLTQIFNAIKSSDESSSNMAKGLNMSYKEAASVRGELTSMASDSGDIFVNTRGMTDSLMSINQSLGTGVKLNGELLTQFTQMRERAGFTNDELQGIANISLTTGKSMNDITGEFMAQAKMSSVKNGVLLNEKELLKGIKDISTATTLSLGKNPKLIGEAVATAKSLGMELNKVDNIANSLLDFESSIESELSAELLLNKDITLEKARHASLNNDLATVAQEISAQIGTSAEFGEMNRIQQEAIAKAVGMNRESLAETLFIQDQLMGATGKRAKEEEDLLNNSIAQIGLTKTQEKLKNEGIEGLRNQAGIADRFSATMEKLKEIFVSLAEPILQIISPFADLVGYLAQSKTLLFAMKMTLAGLATKSVITAIASIFTGSAMLGPAGLIAAGVGTAALMGYIASAKSVGDVYSPADGKTQISTKEGGLFELSNNDDLIAAPNLIKNTKNNNNNNNTTINQGNNETIIKPDNKETNSLLRQLLSTNQESNQLQRKRPELSPVGLYEIQ